MADSVTIVGGCGHVGLPFGIALANAGLRVRLLDTDAGRVRAVADGRMPFLEHDAEPALAAALESGRLTAGTDPAAVADADAVVLTIGTPVDEFLNPKVVAFDHSVLAATERMRDGQLLVLRSTLFPGTTERLAATLARRGLRADVAYCPERIAQGYALRELPRLPQLVAGTTPAAARRAVGLFRRLGAVTLEVTPVEAELAKLFANSYRYLHFAISNQFYMIAQKFGADFYRVYDAVTHQYPRLAGMPTAGFAGGPCLLKDTMQLAGFNHGGFPLGLAAMAVNEGLPHALVESAKARVDLRNCTAAILGMAFKGNVDDVRDSLAFKLRKLLAVECREVLCTDPHVRMPGLVGLDEALARADVVFVGACHDEYRGLAVRQELVDVFNFVRRAEPAPMRKAG